MSDDIVGRLPDLTDVPPELWADDTALGHVLRGLPGDGVAAFNNFAPRTSTSVFANYASEEG